jgi:hypothetical protein
MKKEVEVVNDENKTAKDLFYFYLQSKKRLLMFQCRKQTRRKNKNKPIL